MANQADSMARVEANGRTVPASFLSWARKNLNEITLLIGLIGVSAFITVNNEVFSPAPT